MPDQNQPNIDYEYWLIRLARRELVHHKKQDRSNPRVSITSSIVATHASKYTIIPTIHRNPRGLILNLLHVHPRNGYYVIQLTSMYSPKSSESGNKLPQEYGKRSIHMWSTNSSYIIGYRIYRRQFGGANDADTPDALDAYGSVNGHRRLESSETPQLQ